MFSHYWIYTFISSNTHFRSLFRGYIHICGHDKSDPYGCERFAITLRTDCQNVANGLLIMQRPPTKCVANITWMYSERIANALRIRIRGHDKSDPYGCERIAITLRTPTKCPTNIPQNANEQSVKCATNIPPGVGADSPHTHIHIIKYVYSHY